MVTLLQAYDQVSDADAVETVANDRRWQRPLGCLGAEEAPFSQGVLPAFRERLIAHDLDKKLLDRTVEIAKRTGKFGWQKLKAMLDSSPLLGAGRVEDTGISSAERSRRWWTARQSRSPSPGRRC